MTRAHFPAQIYMLARLIGLAVALFGHTAAWSQSQVQAGRMADGTLWLTDGALPPGAKTAPLEIDQLMSLPTPIGTSLKKTQDKAPRNAAATPQVQLTAEEKATCRSIQRRYNETKAELDTVELKKTAGTLLIPDSGLVTLRQNLATLERLRSLCD